MSVWQWLGLIIGAIGCAWVVGRVAFPVPVVDGRAPQLTIPFDPSTPLGQRAADAQAQHPGESGVIPLIDPIDALDSRLHLARGAQHSLDVMYYIWHDDLSGMLLLNALRDAAARGVRVRLLLDDNGIKGMDSMLAALNAMPNFDVRLFNPSTIRSPKFAGYLLGPLRMNRRMHNKAFIVDGAVAIVGGRNIGDEYFAQGDVPAYLDMDVIGVGPVVTDTSAVFDEYWNSKPVIELERVISGQGDMAAFDAAVARANNLPGAARFAPSADTASARLMRGAAQIEWTTVQVVADDPMKGAGGIQLDGLMIARLASVLGQVDRSLDVISAYFVPGKRGAEFFGGLAQSGVEVAIPTNSWMATDVPMVHAGYIKYRRDLLEAGVTLYELRPLDGQPQGREELNRLGSSGGSLHAKTFAIDDRRVFVGSFNFDPRSLLLNCEMGFLIDSPSMAQAGRRGMTGLGQRSYQPILEDGNMLWREVAADGSITIHKHEPGLELKDRIAVYVLNVLPIEWLL